MEHVHVLRFREVPTEVLFDEFDGIVDQIAICSEAHRLLRIQFTLPQVLVKQRFSSMRSDRALVSLKDLGNNLFAFPIILLFNVSLVRRYTKNRWVSKHLRQMHYLEPTNNFIAA